MTQKQSMDLTQGKISAHVLRMLGPSTVAIIALMSAGVIDTIYLGRLTDPDIPNLGVLALAAVGFAYPLTFIGNSANIGLGAGTLSAVSRAMGEKDIEKARRRGAAAILLALLVMILLITIMIMTLPHVLNLMGAEGKIKDMATSYLRISLPGLILVSATILCSNILRARGEAALPSSFMIVGAVVNIIVDPFLIFGLGPFPRLEVQGAALATFIGYSVGAIVAFYFVGFQRRAITLAGMTLGSIKRAWGVVARVGLPAAGTNIIVPIGATLAVAIIARFLTVEDVAAFTIAGRAEMLSVAMLYALSGCIGAITGQNGGAGLTERVRGTFIFCYLICCVWGTFSALLLVLFAKPIVSVFTPDVIVIAKAIPYFYIVPITVFAYGFVFVSAAGLNALGRPIYGFVYTVARSLLLYVVCIYIGVQYFGLTGAFFGVAIANLLSGFLAFVWTLKHAPMTAKTH